MPDFAVPVARRPLDVVARVPASKSLHQRALLLATLSPVGHTTTLVAGGPAPDDVVALARALGGLTGQRVRTEGEIPGAMQGSVLVGGRDRVRCDLGMNATGLRMLAVAAGLRPAGARTLLTGRPRLRARPHRPLLRALARLGAHARRRPSGALRVLGRPWARHEVAIAAETSSQPASALLLAAGPAGGLRLTLAGDVVSRGYLALTETVLAAFGLPVEGEGALRRVAAGSPRCARYVVEPDASSAAVWWAAAALTGGKAEVHGLSARSCQPDVALLDVLARMGASVATSSAGHVVVQGPPRLGGAGDVDLRDAPDLAPLVAALAAGADGETRVVGAAHLAVKESDRIATAVAAVRAVGGEAEPAADGFVVRGRLLGEDGRARVVAVAGDHRIALAFGALGLRVAGVVLRGVEAVGKSYPGFPAALASVASGASDVGEARGGDGEGGARPRGE